MKTNNKNLKISVIICTYNRSSKIKDTLDSVLNQSLSPQDYEVIVVDDHSQDDTPDLLQQYRGKTRIILNKSNIGVSGSRNLAVRKSRGDILAFTDHDCIVDYHWLENILAVYDRDPEQKIAGLGGEIVPLSTRGILLKYYELHSPLTHLRLVTIKSTNIILRLRDYLASILQPTPHFDNGELLASIVGANMACRREIFNAVSGFDETIRHASEDEDLWTRVRRRFPELSLRYITNVAVAHDYDPSFRDVSRRSYIYGIGRSRLFLKKQDFIPAVYPFPILVIILSLLSFFSINFIPIAIFSVLILYVGWIRVAVQRKNPLMALFSYVQMILELAMTMGFIKGYITLHNQYKSTKQDR